MICRPFSGRYPGDPPGQVQDQPSDGEHRRQQPRGSRRRLPGGGRPYKARERWPKDGVGVSPALEHMAAILDDVIGKPVCIALNKIDKLPKEALLPLMAGLMHDCHLPKSSPCPRSRARAPKRSLATGDNLPEGPPMWPTDQIMDASERFLVAELIRESVSKHTPRGTVLDRSRD